MGMLRSAKKFLLSGVCKDVRLNRINAVAKTILIQNIKTWNRNGSIQNRIFRYQNILRCKEKVVPN